MRRFHFLLLISLFSAVAAPIAEASVQDQPRFKIRYLPDLGGQKTYGTCMNSGGQVAGHGEDAGGVTHGFLWTPGETGGEGTLEVLPLPKGAKGVTVQALTDSGVVAGVATFAKRRQVFKWSRVSGWNWLGEEGENLKAFTFAITPNGGVLRNVQSIGAGGARTWTTLIDDGKESRRLAAPDGGSTMAYGYSGNGVISGIARSPQGSWQACIWDSSGEELQLLEKWSPFDVAYAVNDSGVSVGASTHKPDQHATAWIGKKLHKLGGLSRARMGIAWENVGKAWALNQSSVMVGSLAASSKPGAKRVAVAWELGRAINLNRCVSLASGEHLMQALDIDDAGMILAWTWKNKVVRTALLVPDGDREFAAYAPLPPAPKRNASKTTRYELKLLSAGAGRNASAEAVGGKGRYAYSMHERGGALGFAGSGDGLERAIARAPGGRAAHVAWIHANGTLVGTSGFLEIVSNSPFLRNPAIMPARAAVWTDPFKVPRVLPTLGGKHGHALGINLHGHVVGQAEGVGGIEHGFLWKDKKIYDLGTLGGQKSSAHAINASGLICGWTSTSEERSLPCVWKDREPLTLPMFGIRTGKALALNDAGVVVGHCDVGFGEDAHARACRWTDGKIENLGGLGGTVSQATSINAAGQVVGFAMTKKESDLHAVLWDQGVLYDLNDLVEKKPGWTLMGASQISEDGRIAGTLSIGNGSFGFLLTPIKSEAK